METLIAFIPARTNPDGYDIYLTDMAFEGHSDESLFEKQAINCAHEFGWRADEVAFERGAVKR